MPSVTVSAHAHQDLLRFHDFLALQSVSAADAAIEALLQAFLQLGDHPRLGRRVSFGGGLRKMNVPFGRAADFVYYRFQAGQVVIAYLRHSREARLPPPVSS